MLILASSSPRRVELLTRMGYTFEKDVPNVDETCTGTPDFVTQTVARRKAEAVRVRHPNAIILAADTVVDADGLLGKPSDLDDARRMLHILSDGWHTVVTAVCVLCDGHILEGVAHTRVHFTKLSFFAIEAILENDAPLDKAGAYAIQGLSGTYIDRIEGCPYNVMGLPTALTRQFLERSGG